MDTQNIENDEFTEMIKHLKLVVDRNGSYNKYGIEAARQLLKIETIIKIKKEAEKIKEREGIKV